MVNEVTYFYNKEVSNVTSNHACLALISLDSAINKDGNYYMQVFLKECKCIENKVIRDINDNLSNFSSSDYSDDTDEEWFSILSNTPGYKEVLLKH